MEWNLEPDDFAPPGHGEEPSEGSLALCAHPVEGLYEWRGHVWCRRCGASLRPVVSKEADDGN